MVSIRMRSPERALAAERTCYLLLCLPLVVVAHLIWLNVVDICMGSTQSCYVTEGFWMVLLPLLRLLHGPWSVATIRGPTEWLCQWILASMACRRYVWSIADGVKGHTYRRHAMMLMGHTYRWHAMYALSAIQHADGDWQAVEAVLSKEMATVDEYLQTWKLKLRTTKMVSKSSTSTTIKPNVSYKLTTMAKLCPSSPNPNTSE